jgi:hypothetical protein
MELDYFLILKPNYSMNKIPTDSKVNILQYGIFVYLFERLFRLLQFFPPQCILGNRVDSYKKSRFSQLGEKEQRKVTTRRITKVDVYILVCLVVEIICVILVGNRATSQNLLKYAILIAAILRLIDIIQVNVNMLLFDVLRTGKSSNFVASGERSLINVIINFFEIIICFGLIYNFSIRLLTGANGWTDGVYFSIITQSTLGYGDIAPCFWLKWIACTQVIIGYLFAALIISRFISILPPGKAVLEDSVILPSIPADDEQKV